MTMDRVPEGRWNEAIKHNTKVTESEINKGPSDRPISGAGRHSIRSQNGIES